jgi:2-hydroxy-3-keto-5-methylthiopentenyl-1-phosphate phosphatase
VNLAVLTDFDGTIIYVDTSVIVLKKFAEEDWSVFDRQLERGEITLEECLRKQFSTVKVSRQRILEATEQFMSFRPGFENLVEQCNTNNVPLVIVSAGLNFVIEHFLQQNGWQGLVMVHAPKAKCTVDGVKFSFPKLLDTTSLDFKQDMVKHYRRLGNKVMYVGDGIGDYHAATDADFLFAIKSSKLAEMLSVSKIPHEETTSFTAIVQAIERSGSRK